MKKYVRDCNSDALFCLSVAIGCRTYKCLEEIVHTLMIGSLEYSVEVGRDCHNNICYVLFCVLCGCL